MKKTIKSLTLTVSILALISTTTLANTCKDNADGTTTINEGGSISTTNGTGYGTCKQQGY